MATTVAKTAKAAMGSLLAGSILLTAVPAAAQYRGGHDRYDRRHDGISAGEVIAGAVVLGGLAAILSSDNDRRYGDRYYDRGYDRYQDGYHGGYDWQRTGGSRAAIERCVNAVERRGGRRDDIDVTRITDVDRIRGGYRIEGRVAVDYRDGWRDRDRWDRDGRGGRWDRGGRWNNNGYDDRGSFACTVRWGRVDNVNLRGI